jgi:hypothetical protein
MFLPSRTKRQTGRHALVDGIPFEMPVNSEHSPAFLAVFTIDSVQARKLIPGNEIHPMRLWSKALLVVTVINYEYTDIGKYIEFSIAIACTHGARPGPRLLPALLMGPYGTGQYVVDLPVSTEISVKGGKGIWGMPKHQANLNFVTTEKTVSSQYDLDDQLVMKIEIDRPRKAWLPVSVSGANYCQFRGMLMKSSVRFKGKAGISLFKKGSARLTIGDHPLIQPLKGLGISKDPIFTVYIPEHRGVLDDHFECWFITHEQPPQAATEGLESVVNLGLSQEWLALPGAITEQPEYTSTGSAG